MWTHPVSGHPIPLAPDRPLFELSTDQNEAAPNVRSKNPFTGNADARLSRKKRTRYLSAAELPVLIAALNNHDQRQGANIIRRRLLTGRGAMSLCSDDPLRAATAKAVSVQASCAELQNVLIVRVRGAFIQEGLEPWKVAKRQAPGSAVKVD